MEAERISDVRSGNSGTYAAEIAESLRFQEEIQSLIHPSFDASPVVGGSFTALLGLPASRAVDLLHEPGPDAADSSPSEELWRFRLCESAAARLHHPVCCAPTFPSNAAIVDRAESFSVFATNDSPGSSSGGASSPRLKLEHPNSDSPPSLPLTTEKPHRSSKRKEREKNKAKGATKKSKSSEENNSDKATAKEDAAGDKLPYVHVRARRGQATDSHSLAERARREKINARMKLLQELVPGCSKITGTALVLEEIINHVQYLQRQIEFLSMRLATVNPRIDLSGLDSFLSTEHGPLPNGRARLALDSTLWSPDAATASGVRRQPVQQIWHVDLLCHQPSSAAWARDAATHPHALLDPTASVLGFDPADSGLDLCKGLGIPRAAVPLGWLPGPKAINDRFRQPGAPLLQLTRAGPQPIRIRPMVP